MRRLLQRLQHDAVAERLLDQLVTAVARALDVEAERDAVEADRNLAVDSERPAQIELAGRGHLDLCRLDAGRGRDHLARDLCARGERSEEQVAGARCRAFAADTGVCLSGVGGAADVDRARGGAGRLAAAGAERDPRVVRLRAIPLLQWPLGFAEIHAPTLTPVIRARKVG